MKKRNGKIFLRLAIVILTVAGLFALLLGLRDWQRQIEFRKNCDFIREKFAADTLSCDYAKSSLILTPPADSKWAQLGFSGALELNFAPQKFWETHYRLFQVKPAKTEFTFDFRNSGLNQKKMERYFSSLYQELERCGAKYLRLSSPGVFTLINQKGERRQVEMMLSAFKHPSGMDFLVESADYNVKINWKNQHDFIRGAYSASQEDLSFVQFSFGLPELFKLSGPHKIYGQFGYNLKKHRFDFVNGRCKFDGDSNINGSIFAVKGLSTGGIFWEYIDKHRWKVVLTDAVASSPVRGRLSNLELFQEAENPDAINFNCDIEFYHNAFKDLLDFEQPKNSPLLKHRLIGKYISSLNRWELTRINTSSRAPLVKAKYRKLDLTFNPNSINLSGRNNSDGTIKFNYGIEFDNAEIKQNSGNFFIGYKCVLSGECELNFSSERQAPLLNGEFSFDMADGAFMNNKFHLEKCQIKYGKAGASDGSEWEFGAELLSLNEISGLNLKFFHPDGRLKFTPSSEVRNSIISGKLDALSGNVHGVNSDYQLNFKNFDSSSSFSFNADERPVGGNTVFGFELASLIYNQYKCEMEKGAGRFELEFSQKNSENLLLNRFFRAEKLTSAAKDWSIEDFALASSREVGGKSGDLNAESGTFSGAALKYQDDNFKIQSRNLKADFSEKNWTATANEFLLLGDSWSVFSPEIIFARHENSKNPAAEFTLKNGVMKNLTAQGEISERKLSFTLPLKIRTEKKRQWDLDVNGGKLNFNDGDFFGLQGKLNLSGLDWNYRALLSFNQLKSESGEAGKGQLQLSGNLENPLKIDRLSAHWDKGEIYLSESGEKETRYIVRDFPLPEIAAMFKNKRFELTGTGSGTVQLGTSELMDFSAIESFDLKSSNPGRIRLGAFEFMAQVDLKSIRDQFALAALDDFNYSELEIKLTPQGKNHCLLYVKVNGKANRLLPYEYDVEQKTFIRVSPGRALFNAEVEIEMKYLIKNMSHKENR